MSTVVIGVGNRDRGDDAVGPLLADELADRLSEVTVIAHEGDLSHLPLLWHGDDDVVVIDAALGDGLHVGEVRLLDPGDLARRRLLSTHGVGLADALDLADRLDRRPRSVHVVGIGAGAVELGEMDHDLRVRIPALADEVARIVAAVAPG